MTGHQYGWGKNKTYLLTSGLRIAKTSILDGNGSTFKVEEITDYSNGGNFSYSFFSEYYWNCEMYLLDWKDLNIDFSPSLLARDDGTTKEYMLFYFHNLKSFNMDNVHIVSAGGREEFHKPV